jgi:hypothetical protein
MKRGMLFLMFNMAILIVAYGQWTYDDLSEPKCRLGATSLGNKVYFVAGDNEAQSFSEIEIYDAWTGEWDSTINLSASRSIPSCISSGTKIFVAGGFDVFSGASYAEVDIWDTESETWDLAYMSVPRFFVSAAAKGNKVLLAGGMDPNVPTAYDVVDIYNLESGTWEIAHLSLARAAMACAVVGDLAFFAGGFDMLTSEVTDIVDIYRFSTNTWTTDTLSQGRAFAAAVAVGSKILVAGGTFNINEQSDVVDIYDTATGLWTTLNLSSPRSFYPWNAASVGDNAFFVGGGSTNLSMGTWTSGSDVIDSYDDSLNLWKNDILPQPLICHAVAGTENMLVVGGGFAGPSWNVISTVQILDVNVAILEHKEGKRFLRVYPNPTTGNIHLEFNENTGAINMTLSICTIQGQEFLEQTLPAGNREINLQVPDGVYVLTIRAGDMVQQELVIIQQ